MLDQAVIITQYRNKNKCIQTQTRACKLKYVCTYVHLEQVQKDLHAIMSMYFLLSNKKFSISPFNKICIFKSRDFGYNWLGPEIPIYLTGVQQFL